MTQPLRTVVLVSGTGSNLDALAAASDEDPASPFRITGVIANRPDARPLTTLTARHAVARLIDHRQFDSRDAFEAALSHQLRQWGAELILLAGFMRVLGIVFVREWQGRLLNIHPSLLPLFPGLHTHARALDARVCVHGASVHQVTEGLDDGPLLGQAVVPVRPGDTEGTLARRVLGAEHLLYPAVARAYALHLRDGAPLPAISLSHGFDIA